MNTAYSSPLSARISFFSTAVVRSGGQCSGRTIFSGWGSNVTRTLRRPAAWPRRATSCSTLQWPRCTPSKVPTVATVPRSVGMPGGCAHLTAALTKLPSRRCAHGEDLTRVHDVVLTLPDGDQGARVREQHRARGRRWGKGDATAVHDTRQCGIVDVEPGKVCEGLERCERDGGDAGRVAQVRVGERPLHAKIANGGPPQAHE